jgi:hypothetical protein
MCGVYGLRGSEASSLRAVFGVSLRNGLVFCAKRDWLIVQNEEVTRFRERFPDRLKNLNRAVRKVRDGCQGKA